MTYIKVGLLKNTQEKIMRYKLLSGGAALLVLTLILFGDVLFFSQQMVLSHMGTDLSSQFVHWRYFGFSQLKQGVLPLWNPHIFSGTPYVGGFQSAMFYPLNLLFVIMPLASAINFSIALHVYLLGFFMYLWVLNRGLTMAAALMAGMMAMFCGAFSPHVYAGHLPNLCVMPWVPLLFYSLDRYIAKPAFGPILVGILSVTMQILAGHPQYVFYAGVAAMLYLFLNLFFTPHRVKTVLGFLAIYASASLLSAVQLFTGIAAAAESVRSIVPYDFAAMFSFPYENLLTLIMPGFLGNMESVPYWGRNNFWEMSLFISITGLVLAVYGAIHAEKKIRQTALLLSAVFLIFAFGKYTPLFDLLYYAVPGFNKFRGISKFIFPASLFLILLAASGFHALLQPQATATVKDTLRSQQKRKNVKAQSEKVRKHIPFFAFPLAGGLFLFSLGIVLLMLGNEAYHPVIRYITESGDSYFPREELGNQTFLQLARINSGYQFLWAGGVSLIVGLLFYLGKRRRQILFLLPVLALTELIIFALPLRPTFDIKDVEKPELKQALAAMPGDYRILYGGDTNAAMTLGTSDVSGYDPMVLRRYAEFMAYTQGNDPDNPGQYLDINRYNPLYKMLRFRFVIPDQARTADKWIEFPGTMKRLNLIYNFSILNDRNSIFSTLSSPAFDPAQSVILETAPNVTPKASAESDRVDLVDSSVNHLTIKADLSSPAILLVTDLYASGWQAKALNGSVQSDYQVLPADYILKAVPLKAGHHQFRLFYRPQAFIIGAWVSGLSLFCLIGASLLYYILVARKEASLDT